LAINLLGVVARYMRMDAATQKVNVIEQRAFSALALGCPVEILPEATALFEIDQQIAPSWQPTAASMVDILRFRKFMAEIVALGQ
jgi:hypothetical protein